ncbi:2-phosphosulfolactate phosphatase [Bacillota bacterium LX-D]|nr:2-phosphosulfolactate phosphatase [Bacillota bacterium LX-D]
MIDVIFSPGAIDNTQLPAKSVAVIDVLRATSVMITAIANNC